MEIEIGVFNGFGGEIYRRNTTQSLLSAEGSTCTIGFSLRMTDNANKIKVALPAC
ncbi:hypothetical protein [Hymenobacter norwichensis]|uniref:hypothetical protein n=1 Tax=Hymenobacter norwichensis TaxID=223903 RepID=UPI0012FAB7FF|nr:hypothetical protein [Hymenobacter norwichensis]